MSRGKEKVKGREGRGREGENEDGRYGVVTSSVGLGLRRGWTAVVE